MIQGNDISQHKHANEINVDYQTAFSWHIKTYSFLIKILVYV